MLHISNFDDVACITTGITVTNPAMVIRIRAQAQRLPVAEITAYLGNAIGNATDAAHAAAWETSQFDEPSAETQVDLEYYQELVAAWSLIAAEHDIDTLDVLLYADTMLH